MKRRSLLFSVAAAAALALAASAWIVRRGQAPPGPEVARAARVVPEIARASHEGRPVLFVGLDGADWELLDRYVAAGAMPQLARLVEEGSGGTLMSLHPPLSPLVWTTIMTGVGPLEHGILDFTRWSPLDGRKEPITADERRVPALWNMATYAGRRVAALGMWATYPAEPVNGLMVSDRLFSFLWKGEAPPRGVVFPPERESWARDGLERAEQAVGFGDVRAYLPWLDEAEYRRRLEASGPYADPVSALRRILVETTVYHGLGADWARRERPDLLVLYLQGTDTVGHVFAPFAPPRQPEVAPADYDRYHQVPERYFRYVDELLGEYRRLAQAAGAVLMLASDHGFLWGEGRPTRLSSFAHATAAKWHRKEGIYLIWGRGIAAAPGHPHRGTIEQVCPTLLSLLGLPLPPSGKPLPGIPAPERPAADYAAHYQPVSPARSGARRGDEEALEKLRALGYIGGGPGTEYRSAGSTRTAGSYSNEGLILREQGRIDAAAAAFEKAIAKDPKLASALWNLSDLLFAGERDLDRSDELLVRAAASGLPEGMKYLLGRAIGYQRAGRTQRSLELVTQATKALPEEPEVWLFRGRYRVELRDCGGALEDFETAARLAPANAAAHASQGLARLCLGDRPGAKRSFLRSLEIDPEQPKVREYIQRLSRGA